MTNETETDRDDDEARALARLEAAEREIAEAASRQRRLAKITDYVYDKSQDAYWDLRDQTFHNINSVNASIPDHDWRVVEPPPEEEGVARGRGRPPRPRRIKPSDDIKNVLNDQFVETSTWWPGKPTIIPDLLVTRNGPQILPGRRCYNEYCPPPKPRMPEGMNADRWVDHLRKLWPEEGVVDYFLDYCAHMVQYPEIKCNTAIVLSGTQGIGKDAALVPLKRAVGTWNAKGIDPDNVFSQYNPWLIAVMLVIDEVRPTKDETRASGFYNLLKPIIAAPPDMLGVNDKYMNLRYITNIVRVFLTTNDWLTMFIPPEDRRMFVMHSEIKKDWYVSEGNPDYFFDLFKWFENGGNDAVAAMLRERDLTDFDPKAQSPRTEAWQTITSTWETANDELDEALDLLENPDVLFSSELARIVFDGSEEIAQLLRGKHKFRARMQRRGYAVFENEVGKNGVKTRWSFTNGDKKFISKLAFYKRGMPLKTAEDLLWKRGRELVSDGKTPNTTQTTHSKSGRTLN